MNTPLLQVRNLKVHYPVARGLFRSKGTVKAVDDVSFEIAPGETVGLVGESGCGKSTLARAVARLIEPTAGEILFNGTPIESLDRAAMKNLRRQLQMIFQDPTGSLNPRMTVRQILNEPFQIHAMMPNRKEREEKLAELMRSVGLDGGQLNRYPHEFSGGQKQRIGIARALALSPKLIICDEPVSALDVSIQAQIINLLQDLQQQLGLAYLFIAHDLAVVEHISQRVLVMYLGKVVESGPASAVIQNPKHPYTQALISAVPSLDEDGGRSRIVLSGELPSPLNPPPGCPFHTRCPIAQDICTREMPAHRPVGEGQTAACHFAT